MVWLRRFVAAVGLLAGRIDADEWLEYQQQALVQAMPTSMNMITFTYGDGYEISDEEWGMDDEAVVGVEGSSSSCTRRYGVPIFFVPVDGALAGAERVVFDVPVASTEKAYGGMTLDLHGLGLRSHAVATEADYYIGEGPGDGEVLAAGVISSGVESASVDVTDHALGLYDEWAAAGGGAPGFMALRLTGRQTFGCDEACDGGCGFRQIVLDRVGTAVTTTLDAAAVDAATGFVTEDRQSAYVDARCDGGVVALDMVADGEGNVLPDFSAIGYREGAAPPDDVSDWPTVVSVSPSADASCVAGDDDGYGFAGDACDDAAAIQAAIGAGKG